MNEKLPAALAAAAALLRGLKTNIERRAQGALERAAAAISSGVAAALGVSEQARAHGRYHVALYDADGNLKWHESFDNLVTTVGKNAALDAFLAGSSYSVTGPYLGLINGSASSAVVGDTMASHAAWLEVGGTNAPAYSGGRKTAAWSAASAGAKSTSASASFTFSSGGTVGGCFLVFGSGAVSTVDNTGGVLYSAGAFTGGSKVVSAGDVLNVSYTASL